MAVHFRGKKFLVSTKKLQFEQSAPAKSLCKTTLSIIKLSTTLLQNMLNCDSTHNYTLYYHTQFKRYEYSGLGSRVVMSFLLLFWVSLCWVSSCWVSLCCMSLCCVSLCWVSLSWVSLCWVSLCWVSLCWVSLCWVSLCWVSYRKELPSSEWWNLMKQNFLKNVKIKKMLFFTCFL
jgi:hypothetical protein